MLSLPASNLAIDSVFEPIKKGNESLENQLQHELELLLPPRDTQLGEIARYHFKARGKFIRGKLALITGDSFRVSKKWSMLWALSVELMHNASLVHDDICDHDSIRRGNRNVSAKYGEEVALTFGDWLIGKSFELASIITSEAKETALITSLAKALQITSNGQVKDLTYLKYPNWNEYLGIAGNKTAPLLSIPISGMLQLSGNLCHCGPLNNVLLETSKYYQISNDILNFLGKDGALSPFSDIQRKAPNAVIIKFRDTINASTKVVFDEWLNSFVDYDIEHWKQLINRSSALLETKKALEVIERKIEEQSKPLPKKLKDITNSVKTQIKIANQINF
ncbi:MAG: polyprenyl synthetase family protein [Pseudomonadota bacterium]|nr:polyprenyl synthetase family protein [Pseudomonadota bacterium]